MVSASRQQFIDRVSDSALEMTYGATPGSLNRRSRQLSARQVAQLGRGAPFNAAKALDGALSRQPAWHWYGPEADARRMNRAAFAAERAEARAAQVLTREALAAYREGGKLDVGDAQFRAGVSRGQRAEMRRYAREARQQAWHWAGARRSYERSIGLYRRGSKTRPMTLGCVEGLGELVRHIRDTEPEMLADWKREMGAIINTEVVPPTRRKAPVYSGMFTNRRDYRGARTKLSSEAQAAQRAYVYPDNRAARGQGTRRDKAGALRKSVRKRVTNAAVGVTVGGTKAVPYAGPVIFGWEVRNMSGNNFLWEAVTENMREVTESLLDYAGRHASRLNMRLNYQQRRSPAEWATAGLT